MLMVVVVITVLVVVMVVLVLTCIFFSQTTQSLPSIMHELPTSLLMQTTLQLLSHPASLMPVLLEQNPVNGCTCFFLHTNLTHCHSIFSESLK